MNTKEDIIATVISDEVTNIRFVDDTNYDSENCRNGGSYSFGTEYRKVDINKWLELEHTSGDFCPYCGNWDCHGDCHGDEYCSTNDLVRYIKEFEITPDTYIAAE